MIETVQVRATTRPTGFLWFFRNGDSWHAPETNNGTPYLPNISNPWVRDFFWFCRNPVGNFMGFVIGFEGHDYVVWGPAPVLRTTGRDATPQVFGWKWCLINYWAPFVSYWGPLFPGYQLEFYFGWRPASGGFGLKFIPHKITT